MKIHHTRETLMAFCRYDKDTGSFHRLRAARECPVGSVVGYTFKNGYVYIFLQRRAYLAHRLAWLFEKGSWPDHQIDHINGLRADNRWSNLRAATCAENAQNHRRSKRPGASGYLGVYFDATTTAKNKWRAAIGHKWKTIQLGRFPTPEEAREAYLKKKREIHPFATV